MRRPSGDSAGSQPFASVWRCPLARSKTTIWLALHHSAHSGHVCGGGLLASAAAKISAAPSGDQESDASTARSSVTLQIAPVAAHCPHIELPSRLTHHGKHISVGERGEFMHLIRNKTLTAGVEAPERAAAPKEERASE